MLNNEKEKIRQETQLKIMRHIVHRGTKNRERATGWKYYKRDSN